MVLSIVQPTRSDVAQAMLGFGEVPIYAGSLSQKGYGIGGVLRKFVSSVKPIVTKTVQRALEGVKRGAIGVVGETMKGSSIADSIKKHAVSEGKRLLGDSLGDVVNNVGLSLPPSSASDEEPSRKRRKTVGRPRTVNRSGRHRRVVSSKGTIFE